MMRILSVAEYHTPTTRRILSFVEWSFAVVSLLLYSGGPLFLILSGGYSEGDEDIALDFPIARAIFFFNYLVCLFLVSVRLKKALTLFAKNKLLLLLIGLICVSVFWSVDPYMTLRRSLALIGTTLFGAYLGSSYSLKQQIRLLAWTFGIAIFLSFFFVLVLPKYGVMGGLHAGAWRGIYTHKNVLGKMMVLSSAIFLVLFKGTKVNLFFWLPLLSSAFLLLRSSSKTSLVNLLIIALIFFAARVFKLEFRLRTILIILSLLLTSFLAILAMQVLPDVLAAMGKNLTLSGRTTLWISVLRLVSQRTFQGYGYGASWNSWEDATAYVWKAEGWEPPNSHNGFLDIFLDLGLIGLVTFFLGFFTTLSRSISRIYYGKTSEVFWPVMFMAYLVLANLSETSLLLQNSIFWIVYVAISLSLTQPIQEEVIFLQNRSNSSLLGLNR